MHINQPRFDQWQEAERRAQEAERILFSKICDSGGHKVPPKPRRDPRAS